MKTSSGGPCRTRKTTDGVRFGGGGAAIRPPSSRSVGGSMDVIVDYAQAEGEYVMNGGSGDIVYPDN